MRCGGGEDEVVVWMRRGGRRKMGRGGVGLGGRGGVGGGVGVGGPARIFVTRRAVTPDAGYSGVGVKVDFLVPNHRGHRGEAVP